jgi:hypothetical protein
MQRACGSVLALWLFIPALAARAADDPSESRIQGTIDMVDYVHRTISIIPLKPIGETFRLADNCKIMLDRKGVEMGRLEPGARVELVYNQTNSTVTTVFAVPPDHLPNLRIEKRIPSDPPAEQVTGLRTRSYVRIDVAVSPGMLTIRAMR